MTRLVFPVAVRIGGGISVFVERLNKLFDTLHIER